MAWLAVAGAGERVAQCPGGDAAALVDEQEVGGPAGARVPQRPPGGAAGGDPVQDGQGLVQGNHPLGAELA
ncbi:MAG TPA: hypothetical protein VNF47_07680 [Streptosporangiaceae bacterium]|nr:hypothetical protein [Streptosporangiaceae bacterium]